MFEGLPAVQVSADNQAFVLLDSYLFITGKSIQLAAPLTFVNQ